MPRRSSIFFVATISRTAETEVDKLDFEAVMKELESLGKEEFIRILTEPKNALIKQYKALMETEGIRLVFQDEAIAELAEIATIVNERTENIGARRLHTIMEKLLDEISFDAPDITQKEFTIDAYYVQEKLSSLAKDEDLSRYIL